MRGAVLHGPHDVRDEDLPLPLDQVAERYRAMDERRAITALLRTEAAT